MKLNIPRSYSIIFFLLSLVVGLSYVIFFVSKVDLIYPDAYQYDALGWNLAQGRGYVENGDLIMQRPPVYPLFLAGVYYIFGHRYFPVILLQVIMNALSVVLIYRITLILFDKKVSFWSGLTSCFYPSFIIYSGVLLSENVFIFLILASVYIWLKAVINPRLRLFILLGITLGLAALTRPVALLIPVLVFFSPVLFKQKRVLFKFIALALIFSLVNLPWVLRNYYRYHAFIPTVLGGGAALWIGSINWDSKIEYDEKGDYKGTYKEMLDMVEGLNPLEKDSKYKKEALKNIVSHPFKYIIAIPSKTIQLYIRPAGYGVLGERGEGIFQKLVFLTGYILILLFSIIGSFLAIKERNRFALICLSVIIYISAIYVLTNPNDPRYHLPAMPFIIILACYGFAKIKERIQRKEYV